MRDEILDDLLDAIEIYFSLTERTGGSVVKVCKDSKDVEPTLDYVLMREDVYKRIIETSRELQSL